MIKNMKIEVSHQLQFITNLHSG